MGLNQTKSLQVGCKGGEVDDAGGDLTTSGSGTGGVLSRRMQSKEQDPGKEESYAVIAPAEAKDGFSTAEGGGEGGGRAGGRENGPAEEKHQPLSTASSTAGPKKGYAFTTPHKE